MTQPDKDLFPEGLSGIIFDCDGVMIDSEAANRHFYNSILAYLKLPPMTPEQERYAFQATSTQALRAMTPPEMHPRLEEAIQKALDYDRDILPRTLLMPGFREFIDLAHGQGLKLAIDTNRTDLGISKVLDFFHLPPYFNPIVSSSTVAEPKPSPEGVRHICKAWGARPGQALMVGDSEDDREAAHGAGVVFAAFGGGLKGEIEAANYQILAEKLGLVKPDGQDINK